MDHTIVYVVKGGDWLAKIAQEHGTTVGAIFHHPKNAAHKAKRRSPDVLYAGDVLHIPQATLPPPEVEVPPSPPGTSEPPAPPWPFPRPIDPVVTPTVPTWDCPSGACVCHPHDDTDEEAFALLLFDHDGRRMNGARCRVYQGHAVLFDGSSDAHGWVSVPVTRMPSFVEVEWTDASLSDPAPYHAICQVRLRRDDRAATSSVSTTTRKVGATAADSSRLDHLGFRDGTTAERVRAFQRRYRFSHVTGKINHIRETLALYHDEHRLPPTSSRNGDAEGASFSSHEVDSGRTTPSFLSGAAVRADASSSGSPQPSVPPAPAPPAPPPAENGVLPGQNISLQASAAPFYAVERFRPITGRLDDPKQDGDILNWELSFHVPPPVSASARVTVGNPRSSECAGITVGFLQTIYFNELVLDYVGEPGHGSIRVRMETPVPIRDGELDVPWYEADLNFTASACGDMGEPSISDFPKLEGLFKVRRNSRTGQWNHLVALRRILRFSTTLVGQEPSGFVPLRFFNWTHHYSIRLAPNRVTTGAEWPFEVIENSNVATAVSMGRDKTVPMFTAATRPTYNEFVNDEDNHVVEERE